MEQAQKVQYVQATGPMSVWCHLVVILNNNNLLEFDS